jgi:hypothetical protein
VRSCDGGITEAAEEKDGHCLFGGIPSLPPTEQAPCAWIYAEKRPGKRVPYGSTVFEAAAATGACVVEITQVHART